MLAKTKGVEKSEIIAAREEKPDIRTTTIQIRAAITPTGNERTNITPYVVATPFPPLNLSHKGNMCPSTTANAAATAQSGPQNDEAIKVAAEPFPMSKTKVAPARPLFPVRSMLVAPMLPEPIFLGSVVFVILLRSKPNETEPSP